MNTKEVVNLRKLGEFYDEYGRDCSQCPFRDYCHSKDSIACMMEDMLGMDVNEDIYDMERKGTLDNRFQIVYNIRKTN